MLQESWLLWDWPPEGWLLYVEVEGPVAVVEGPLPLISLFAFCFYFILFFCYFNAWVDGLPKLMALPLYSISALIFFLLCPSYGVTFEELTYI